MRYRIAISSFAAMLFAAQLSATIFGSIRGLVHDPQHRPIAGAQITVQAENSDFKLSAISNPLGQFQLTAVPVGRYLVTVTAPGFGTQQRRVRITSESAVDVHIPLSMATVSESVQVTAPPEEVNPESSTSTTTVQGQQIAQTPGAESSNSMAMITDYVPGAVMVHDQLHIRGGHQVSWLIDGVPVPNTNIASNVGPQLDPKEISELEVQGGGYSAEYGDRTFGVFNVVTRSGFERDRQAELVTSYGSFNQTNDQFSFGDHP